MKKFILALFLLPFFCYCQNSYRKEFSLVSDNDLFISYVNDRYYSSGLFFKYRYINENYQGKGKKINHWSLEHKIFTPFKSIVIDKSQHDRPFAALLYVTKGNLLAQKNSIRQHEFQLGIMGPGAIGKEFQTWIHSIYGFEEPIGWRYQIENSLAINYLWGITKKIGKKYRKYSDSFYSYGFSVGTIHTNAQISLGGRIGFKSLASMNESMAFGTHLSNNTKRNIESFLLWKISHQFVLYDATLQGGLFENESPVTFQPNRVRFSAELGYMFTAKDWNFGYKVVLNTNERQNLVNNNGHFYGTIFLSKLFN